MIRPYQHGALWGDERGKGAFPQWDGGSVSTLVNLPTGAGKTYTSAQVILEQRRRYPEKRILFAVHLREIVYQARKELFAVTGLDVGLELAGSKSSTLNPEPIITASIQTLQNRLDKFPPEEFSLVILDEIHHGTTDSWQKVVNHFKQNSELKILGLSATPERADKVKLGKVVDSVAYEYSLRDATKDGWLVKPRQKIIEIPGLDLRKVRTLKKDLDPKALAEAMVRVSTATAHRSIEAIFGLYPKELTDIPEEQWNEYIGLREPKRTLAFCVNVMHAEKVCNAINSFREGLSAFVSGETPHDQRREIFRRFKNGDVPVLTNCGVTVEGYDNPYIEVLLMLRPTKSKPLFLQMLGRGTRSWPGTLEGKETPEDRKNAIKDSRKPYVTVVDFTGNSGKHKLVTVLDIFGPDVTPKERLKIERAAKEKEIDVEELAEELERERYKLSKQESEEYEVDGFTGRKKKKKLTKEQREAARLARENRAISQKEWDMLVQQKLHPEKRTEQENKEFLKQIRHRQAAKLCSFRQGFALQRYGFGKEELKTMSKWDAGKLLDAIASNRWRPIPKQELLALIQKPEPSFTERLINKTANEYEIGAPAF